MPILLILLLLIGCSYNIHNTNISFGKIYNINPEQHGFNQKLYSFQFLLRHGIDDMIDDLNYQDFGCPIDLTLDISFKLHDTYNHIEKKKELEKKVCSYKLYYTIYGYNKYYSGEIKAIDSFFIPSSDYAYILSKEDSELAGINNLIKQLDHEITAILHNNCR